MKAAILPIGIVEKSRLIIGCAFGLYHLYAVGIWNTYPMYLHLIFHLFPIQLLIFLTYTAARKKIDTFRLIDMIPCLLTIALFGYFIANSQGLYERIHLATPENALNTVDIILGSLFLILCLEAARRIIGNIYVIVIIVFILIVTCGQYLPGHWALPPCSWEEYIESAVWSYDSGVWAVPLRVSATLIIMFFIFGKLLEESGIASFFVSLSHALAGRARGGPAKVAVIGSMLVGSVTGGPATNIVITGSFTIPMMIKTGYRPHYAGAVECAASTGSSILPPVMTGIAFLMAELVGVPYFDVVTVAAIPAILYFVAVFMQVHFRAVKLGLEGPTEKQDILRGVLSVLKEKGHLVLPIVVLVVLLFLEYPATMAAFWSIVTIAVAASLKKNTRMSPKRILICFAEASQDLAMISIACALGGLILLGLYTTGLSGTISHYASLLVEHSLLFGILLGGATCMILSMGVPVLASYLITVLIVAPVMVGAGIKLIVAHLFCMYLANMAFITPPIAVGAFVAANIANASYWRVGFAAIRLAMAGFIVPAAFIYRPAMVMDGSIAEILFTIALGIVMVASMASALEGWLLKRLNIFEMVLMGGACIALIAPHTMVNIGAIALIVMIMLWQLRSKLGRFKRSLDIDLAEN